MPKLKLKKERFVKAYIKHDLNGTKAYLETHPNASIPTARVEACNLLAKPEIENRVEEILNESDLSLENVLPSLKEEAHATKRIVLTNPNNRVVEIPDYPTRLECKKLLLKAHGILNDSPRIEHRTLTLNIDPAKLDIVLDKLSKLNKQLGIDRLAKGEVINVSTSESNS